MFKTKYFFIQSVGMGTLAGSNVLLLTLPLAGTIWWGRCDVVNDNAKVNEHKILLSIYKLSLE